MGDLGIAVDSEQRHSVFLLWTRALITGFALVALLVTTTSCSREPVHEAIAAGSTVIAFGDSITFGTGARPGEDFPGQLAALTEWNIINAGIPGDMARLAP